VAIDCSIFVLSGAITYPAMSRASKFTLAATGLGTLGIVCFVHWAQEADRAVCYGFNTMILRLTNFLVL
jgi:hypothetical protein